MIRTAAAGLAALALLAAGCGGDDSDEDAQTGPPQADTTAAPPAGRTGARELVRSRGGPKVTTVVKGLEVPWELAFLPDGRALITERPGRVRVLDEDGRLLPEPAGEVETVAVGESGLLGLAVDPGFRRNSFVYLYRTVGSGTDIRANEVVRYRLRGNRLEKQRVIVSGIPAAENHDGGRLKFGPDRRLYISTGDAVQDALAQDSGSLAGKILRMDPGRYRGRGGRPEVFSMGHRNPQGFAWQPRTGRLVEDEHGPDGDDEVNVIEEGGNYGWPDARGADHGRFKAPVAVYAESIAPSGATFVTLPRSAWTGDYLIGALVGEQLRRVGFEGAKVTANEPMFQGRYGRIRTVVESPDGALYALTSNRDGRGTPRPGDDRVLRIVPPAG